MTDISINGRKLSKFNPIVNLDNENIYSQKDLDEEREAVIDRVLEIINEKETAYKNVKFKKAKDYFDIGWVSCAKEIRWSVLALKGGDEK